ncbi:Protein CBG14803 [Caenorhabditis briggsae]|uniref:Uncharacterized protein n=2 Tax=Caenorhabditis briggsae TaxID=6238 RepID=A0AAE8ZVZ8_CAEBR|nr:Protein CBG14803 [Caenorhabditis briggsae]ULT82455.1 hypothetical protein L3Y34_012017 [Caenorhabditis briggsae]UMM41753.1 hypothetical protein L5515_017875 [Caenorhabditis briggsae]CAP33226.2 Protein CBG14803 [Caenorhabditis briggsae]
MKLELGISVILSILNLSDELQEPCFLKCKDNYMNGMQFDMGDYHEWSVDMVTPMNSLLKFAHGKMALRLTRACKRNDEYHSCLQKCPNVPAKDILIKGQNVWMILCHDFRNDTDFRVNIVPCWSDYGHQISTRCENLATFLQSEVLQLLQGGPTGIQESLDSLCKSVYDYDKCFVNENYDFCGSSAARFLVKLNHQTSHTILELLDQTNTIGKLPKSCKDWLNQKGMTGWQKTKTVQRKLRNCAQLPFFAFSLIAAFFVRT